jgi:hypothetical protein
MYAILLVWCYQKERAISTHKGTIFPSLVAILLARQPMSSSPFQVLTAATADKEVCKNRLDHKAENRPHGCVHIDTSL